jgi:hypothetical protein
VRVLLLVPESVHEKFEYYMKECLGNAANGDAKGSHVEENGFC